MDHGSHIIEGASEEAIIEKILAGDTASFELLIRRYNTVLYKIARSYGFNHQDAEDLMQETHFAAYTHLASFGLRASYKTWMSKIMINKCLYKLNYGYTKNEQPASSLADENDMPLHHAKQPEGREAAILRKEFSNILENSLKHLPLAYRSVFILREIEGFSVVETADLLNITPVNVKVRLNRAKTMLQKSLEQYYTVADIYEFNLVHCNAVVENVFKKIATNQ